MLALANILLHTTTDLHSMKNFSKMM